MSFEQSIKFHTLDTREEEKHNQKPNIHRHTHIPFETCCGHPLARVGRRSSATKPREGRPSQAKTPISFPLSCVCAFPPSKDTHSKTPTRPKKAGKCAYIIPPSFSTPSHLTFSPGKTHTYFSRRTLVSLPGRPSSLVRSLFLITSPPHRPPPLGVVVQNTASNTTHTSPRNVARAVVPRKTMVVHPKRKTRLWMLPLLLLLLPSWTPHVT